MVESAGWFVGIKNWKPENDIQHITMLERHLLTDEVFILLDGKCTLLLLDEDEMTNPRVHSVPMEPYKVYCIPKGAWHNTITWPGVKLALIENRDTSAENSEFMPLSGAMREQMIAALASPVG
ncbi:cupin [Klebsiella oxytoca]|uniref:cupin n=1 Tax=Klebsiella oxytoca TaxID=571 RepID=UPI00157B2C57|nr:cupin [Klebsiella oxytoca]